MEQRKHYRVTEPISGLRIAICTAGGVVGTSVVDVSAGGAALKVLAHEIGEIQPPQMLDMQIHSGADDPGFVMPVEVRHRLDADDHCTLGVQFIEPKLLEKHLPAPVFATFNRRNSFRVRPASDESISVAVNAADGQVIEFVLGDISAGGCGGIAAADGAGAISLDDKVVARFSLPGISRHFELRSVVRCCLSIEQGTRIGLQFDEGARNFPAQESSLMDYIMLRQHAQLQLAS